MSENLPKRTDTGQFVKGQSGNPDGRPKGSRNQITLLRESLELALREEAEPEMLDVMRTALALAKSGDRSMIKLLLELHMSKSAPEGGNKADRAVINIFGPKKEDVIDVTPISGEDDSIEDGELLDV